MEQNVAILGLGNMGTLIAQTAILAGAKVTVWNRTVARCASFEGRCQIAGSLEEAVEQSNLIICVLLDYDSTKNVLQSLEPSGALNGKKIVQLATGTPEDAQDLSKYVGGCGASYLDGKIFTYPARVGMPMTRFAYAGDKEIYDTNLSLLKAFSGRPLYLGGDPGCAPAMDLAWLSFLYGATIGLLQGIAFTRSQGIKDDALFDTMASWLVELQAESDYCKQIFATENYKANQASLNVHLGAVESIIVSATNRKISMALPKVIASLMGDAISLGHGDDEIAAVIKAIQQRPETNS